MTMFGRNEPIYWPVPRELSDAERAIVMLYRVGAVNVAGLEGFEDRTMQLLKKRKTVGIFSGDKLVGIVRHRFPGDETVVYTLTGTRLPVLFGATGEQLQDYSQSIIALHSLIIDDSIGANETGNDVSGSDA
ncbi:hypothetical protein [Burkholderia cepacia]|uniref:Uncharacterized protein n=1 Tax=Burkholderia cepacia TaxID=292 RepID=A0AAX2RKD7_BURCE|nr:hypothetical protein [Burkholderia cepacia]TES99627.1 hypothetical protein E3D36_24380 [Burkholderia cepacia]TEU41620.1 hypothetical protein E3D37_26765 [Burkholderia cepacia]TEU48752.1 hypothetical protein E3D38_21370 [Burkholderia cepacia]TEU95361.1 hypothetical protein E3D40_24855 [Burkholderia cepacia]TEV04755.1 hypothetical protein E3D44_26380 [Burkholderia cepacia]